MKMIAGASGPVNRFLHSELGGSREERAGCSFFPDYFFSFFFFFYLGFHARTFAIDKIPPASQTLTETGRLLQRAHLWT